MSLTYAIPDLHGRHDLLDAALERIADLAAGRAATIVTLGDYVDRGPNSRQVVERLMEFRSERIRLIALKGNHEAMMWEACNRRLDLSCWIENGGDRTLASYRERSGPADSFAVPRSHLQWIAGLALMHVDRQRVYVHAAVDPAVPLQQQREQTLLWKRYPEGYSKGHGHRHVVHGHHATPQAPIVTPGKTNLDGLAWKTGRLVVGVFDDDQSGAASDYLEILGQPA
ncbi:MAG TPA: metallophosphoesterase [Pseudolabrys sp.]|jgi:serine/threonine protein phosphatase 1|nr:metallophosphoesterase [Pseudolabrys sp.]